MIFISFKKGGITGDNSLLLGHRFWPHGLSVEVHKLSLSVALTGFCGHDTQASLSVKS